MNDEEDFTDELKVWALEHFSQMAIKAVWRPDGTGLRYRKTDDETLQLEHRVDHPDSLHHHERITRLFATVNIGMTDEDVLTSPAALSAEDAFRMEMQERQAVAASWTHECGTPLASMPLELGVPMFIGDREVLIEDGETQTVEDWAISVTCTECDGVVLMNPDDFNLLAGDGLFMRYKPIVDEEESDMWYVAMTRQQMYETAETGELGVLVGSECPDTGGKVPPWMWGTYCQRVPHTDYMLKVLDDLEEE